jgi:hypothetical protein
MSYEEIKRRVELENALLHDRRMDEAFLRESRTELQDILKEPKPQDPAKAIERTKRCADLLSMITDAQGPGPVTAADTIKIVHESFFAIAYKYGVEEGKRQATQTPSSCAVCAERRRRNREAAALARKRSRGEVDDESASEDSTTEIQYR